MNYVDGRFFGDYYSHAGEYITSDGIDDNKIYLVSQKYIDNYHRASMRNNNITANIAELQKGAEVDHIVPKSKGGKNTNDNLQILSKEENLKKSNIY